MIKKIDKNEVLQIILAFSLILAIIAFQMIMINPFELIKREIEKMGYEVIDLKVEQVNFWKMIYKSSIVVSNKDGQVIEYWKIKSPNTLFSSIPLAYAEPYYVQ